MKAYAGIGSRQTPAPVLWRMTEIAKRLAKNGWWLRSGGARGADTAFEIGAGSNKQIFRAEDATLASINMASRYHPAWNRCSSHVRKLHGRNMMIMLGPELVSPVQFVICWTPRGQIVGGTGQALRVAMEAGIKIYNLYSDSLEGQIDW